MLFLGFFLYIQCILGTSGKFHAFLVLALLSTKNEVQQLMIRTHIEKTAIVS